MKKIPLAIIDSLEHIHDAVDYAYLAPEYNRQDIQHAIAFLKSYRGSVGTFNSYRREIVRWIVRCEHRYAREGHNACFGAQDIS